MSRFLGVLAVVAAGGALWLLLLRRHPASAAIREHALPLAAAIATTAMLGSLWYSEVAGFVPCDLCWYQRYAMYPLAIVLTISAIRGDQRIRLPAAALAGIGLTTSAWHVAVQRVPSLSGATSCSAESPCSAMWVEVFGLLTIPTMAACGFLAVLVLLSSPSPTSRTPTR